MQMTDKLKKAYFTMEKKLILPEEKGENNQALVASAADNFASLSFRMSNQDIIRLSHASRDDIIQFYQFYYPLLEEAVGADKEYQPFYPNFPNEVMGKSEVEFLFDQLIYGLTGFAIEPSVYEKEEKRLPYLGYTAEHMLRSSTEEEAIASVESILYSPTAYSPTQQKYLNVYLTEYALPQQKQIDISAMPNHENRVGVLCMLRDAGAKDGEMTNLLTDANDILRYAAVRSAQLDIQKQRGILGQGLPADTPPTDVYSYASLRFPKTGKKEQSPSFLLPRSERAMLVKAIEKNAEHYGVRALEEQMLFHKKYWKQLIKGIHIGDYPKAPLTALAFQDISTNQPVARTARTVEEAIKRKDIHTALSAAAKKPGDFVRRMDKFLQMGLMSGDVSPVLRCLQEVAPKASVPTLLSLMRHVEQRTKVQEERTFHIAASHTTFTKADSRIPLTPLIARMVRERCENGVVEQMKGKEIFDKDASVYISPSMRNYRVPNDMRESAEGLHSYTRGSRVDTGTPSDVRRLFCWWTNTDTMPKDMVEDEEAQEDNRVDIDLSASFYDKNGVRIGICSWDEDLAVNNDGQYAALHSGDVQDGGDADGPGRAEFIDLHMDALREMGVKYIVPSVDSYSCQSFRDMPNITFGYMDKDEHNSPIFDGFTRSAEQKHEASRSDRGRGSGERNETRRNFGELFDARTVKEQYKLTTPTTSSLPCIFELQPEVRGQKANEHVDMIWADMPYNGRIASRDEGEIQAIMRVIQSKSTLSLKDLAMMNCRATETPCVADPREAEYLFVTEKELQELKDLYPDTEFDEKTIIFPTDLNYITGTLLPTAKEMSARQPAKVQEQEMVKLDMDALVYPVSSGNKDRSPQIRFNPEEER